MGFFSDAWNGMMNGGYSDYANELQNGMNSVNNSYKNAVGFMHPYDSAGLNEMPGYQHSVNAESDPNAFINHLMSNYQMSPQAIEQQKQGTQGINAAAAASGSLGSGPEMKSMAAFNQNLSNNDQNNYLQQRLGVYDNYLNNANGIINRGYGAAGQDGGYAMDQGADLAQLYNQKGQADANRDEWGSNLLGNTIGGLF